MNKGKIPYFTGGGLLCLHAALLLAGNIIMLRTPGFESAAKPFTFFIIQITPEGFNLLYIILPALVILSFGLTVVFREKLFTADLCVWFPRILFLCVGVNLALTYAAPQALIPMYESLRSWAGIDLFRLLGPGALLRVAMFGVGCYLIWKLGFDLISQTRSAVYLLVHSASLAGIIFIWIPVLIAHNSLAPGRTIVKPLLAVFCLLYYIIFQTLRGRLAKSKGKDGRGKYSVIKLLIVTVFMGVLLIPYLHAVYLFIDSWATFIVAGVLALIVRYGGDGRNLSPAAARSEKEALENRRREESERQSQRRMIQEYKDKYEKKN